MKRWILYGLIFISSVACTRAESYDGQWWESVSKDERLGFLEGYIDCAVYDAGLFKTVGISWYLLEPKITKYYENNRLNLNKPVDTIIFIYHSSEEAKSDENAERYPEKHGIFDGEYWRQSSVNNRRGFIEGYLFCQKKYNKPAVSYSRNTQWYVANVSEWYGIEPNDPSEINAKRSSKKIADVLYLLKD